MTSEQGIIIILWRAKKEQIENHIHLKGQLYFHSYCTVHTAHVLYSYVEYFSEIFYGVQAPMYKIRFWTSS